jgi:hypothetical protein
MERYLTIRVPKRLLKAVLVLTIVGAVIAPIAVSASHTFTDVTDNNVFHDHITWLADAGVTKGCNPPTNDQFCPDDNVTRGQMAAFMKRLAEAKVVDAATAVNATTADSATNADNAETLEGFGAGSFAMGNPTQGTPILYTGPNIDIPTASDTVIISTQVVDLPDYCGSGNTLHELMLMGGGTVQWVAGAGEGRLGLTVDSTALSFNGTTRVFSLSDVLNYGPIESHHVAVDLAPGTHTLRLMGDGFNGDLDFRVRNANLTVVEMGWSCM